VTVNKSADIMHAILEGVCRYNIGKILWYFIILLGCFTLGKLNERIRGHAYGTHDQRSKPPPISEAHIKNKMLNMSSSEMRCFLQVLPLLIGDLIANKEDPHWKLLLKLRYLTEVVHLKSIHKTTWQYLRTIISEYLQSLTKLYPHDCIKPKHHFLIHYPTVMREMGPLSHFSSMRGESKHQVSKKYSAVSQNRMNIAKSLAIKNQFILNYRFLEGEMGEGRGPEFIPGPKLSSEGENIKHVSYLGMEIDLSSIIMIPGYLERKFYSVKEISLPSNTFRILEEKLGVEL